MFTLSILHSTAVQPKDIATHCFQLKKCTGNNKRKTNNKRKNQQQKEKPTTKGKKKKKKKKVFQMESILSDSSSVSGTCVLQPSPHFFFFFLSVFQFPLISCPSNFCSAYSPLLLSLSLVLTSLNLPGEVCKHTLLKILELARELLLKRGIHFPILWRLM